eukprot:jgi/Psemu1/312806/fgenesh1_kg.1022_\
MPIQDPRDCGRPVKMTRADFESNSNRTLDFLRSGYVRYRYGTCILKPNRRCCGTKDKATKKKIKDNNCCPLARNLNCFCKD